MTIVQSWKSSRVSAKNASNEDYITLLSMWKGPNRDIRMSIGRMKQLPDKEVNFNL